MSIPISKQRSNIENIQARQRRYRAMGRCWCGRPFRPGYKRCANCVERIANRRSNYQKEGRCWCGKPLIPRTKPNGTLYKTCQQCRERDRLRYHQRKGN